LNPTVTPEWKERLALVVGALAEAYRQTITAATIKGYEMGLDDLPIEVIERAAKTAMRQNKFMPTVVELREAAGEIRPEQRAALVWSVAMRALTQYGPYRAVDFDDPVLNATIRAFGGWPDFDALLGQMTSNEAEGIFRKRFEQTYMALLARGISEESGKPLSGLSEIRRPPERIACDLPELPTEKTQRLLQHSTELVSISKAS